MADVSDALASLKAVLAAIDPSPQPSPGARIWVWPDDYATISFETFPFIIVAQMVNRVYSFRRWTKGMTRLHTWEADISICLAAGPLHRMAAAQTAELKQEPWLLALADILFDNQGLQGNVYYLGDDRGLFTYRIGHINWDGKIFWGVRAFVPVTQVA